MADETLTESLTKLQWDIAHAIAQTLVKDNTDVNELGKAIAYLRDYANRENAGVKFFDYLEKLVKHGEQISHSKQTPRYYKNIENACSKYLKAYQDDAQLMLHILGWASRLMRYYKNAGPIEEITAPVVESARQAEIAEVVANQTFQEGQKIEAKIINKTEKGKKVTYEISGAIKLSQKEPKNYDNLSVGQSVTVEITTIKYGKPTKIKLAQ